MQLLAIDGFIHVATEPRACDRSKTQVFHASHDAVNGTVPVDEIFDGEGSEAAGVFVVTEIDSRIASDCVCHIR